MIRFFFLDHGPKRRGSPPEANVRQPASLRGHGADMYGFQRLDTEARQPRRVGEFSDMARSPEPDSEIDGNRTAGGQGGIGHLEERRHFST